MNDLRSGEGGKAQPVNLFWHFFPFSVGKTRPSASKFEGKWHGGEEPEGPDALNYKEQAKYRELNNATASAFPYDNVSMVEMGTSFREPRNRALPHFTDFTHVSYSTSMNRTAYAHYLKDQADHCVGNLGEDHPTCRKAEWYYAMCGATTTKSYLEDMTELGHFDLARKWGVKNRRSFLPNYQPTKKYIPGAYEFYRSAEYLEKFALDGSGEWTFPYLIDE
eukprot:Rhum_TRINITY_DN15235_c20_g1::Rhum_TRINITY_DN15235_c20_g1_i1::g.146260::m.146260